jgi:predicted glycosyltransferase
MNSQATKNKHYLFHLGHPAHYHVFKNTIKTLTRNGCKISILIKKKDILETLLKNDGLDYLNILPKGRHDSKAGLLLGMLTTDFNLLKYCIRTAPDLLIGTSYAISHIGRLLTIPSINVNEDDWNVVPLYSKLSYPGASVILSPFACDNGKWEYKSVKYHGCHELAYLHPQNFTPDINIANKYIDATKKYFIVRFSNLKAHHDKGVQGITDETANRLIELLKPAGNIYLTSERPVSSSLEQYRLKINPLDVHHIMAFAYMYIGDSQTMANEAGVLGVPFIRYNDFVGRIGYLNKMENNYQLGYGFKPEQKDEMLQKVSELLSFPDIHEEWKHRRNIMLNDSIDVNSFLTWFIEYYPDSARIMRENPDYQFRFK